MCFQKDRVDATMTMLDILRRLWRYYFLRVHNAAVIEVPEQRGEMERTNRRDRRATALSQEEILDR